ncbi:MAG TPA: transposase [Spirochaetota bacterium]|nr:transposase [Spirochaetota bacterium]
MESKIIAIIERNFGRVENLSDYEQSVFEKILHCRSEPVPFLFTRCDSCAAIHPVYKSCKDRMCPVCNGAASVKWAAKRESEILSTGYFLLTYTVPSQLRPLFLANKKLCYGLLFKSVSRSLAEGVLKNDREFHGIAGFFAMLHTWDQRLLYHPHLHVVIPAGCLSDDSTRWVDSNPSFFLPVKKMSADFRRKLLFYLRKEYKAGSLKIPEEIEDVEMLLRKLSDIPWVVHSQPPGQGRKNPEQIFRYLSRYVAKSAVSDKRIRKVENGMVSLSYYDRKKKQAKTEIITESQFMKRLILHFLPKGFKKVRFFGFMANRYRSNKLILCRMLLGQSIAEQEVSDKELLNDTAFLFWKYFGIDITLCQKCGVGHIHYVRGHSGAG